MVSYFLVKLALVDSIAGVRWDSLARMNIQGNINTVYDGERKH